MFFGTFNVPGDWWPGAGVFVFSLCLISLSSSTDRASARRRMGKGNGFEDVGTFGELRSVRIVGLLFVLAGRLAGGV